LTLEGGFVKTRGPNLETKTYSRQRDKQGARVACAALELPRKHDNVVEPRVMI